MAPLTEKDQARVMAYVEGALSETEQIELELRMKDDEELAGLVRNLVDGTPLVEQLSAAAVPPTRRAHWPRWIGSVAAAAVAILFLWRATDSAEPSLEDTRVAVVRNQHRALAAYADSQPELHGLRPSTDDSLRGPPEGEDPRTTPATDFLALAEPIERAERSMSLRQGTASVAADFFFVPIEAPVSCSVVILGSSPTGTPRRVFPRPEGEVSTQLGSLLLGAGTHSLPGPRVTLSDDGRIHYEPGFVRKRGETELTLSVGFRARPLAAAELEEIDAALARGSSDVTGILRDAGFEVRELRVLSD